MEKIESIIFFSIVDDQEKKKEILQKKKNYYEIWIRILFEQSADEKFTCTFPLFFISFPFYIFL